jgi:hypothetical protein
VDDGLRPLFQPERNFVVPTLHQLWSSGAFGQKQPVDRHRGRGAEGRVQAIQVDIYQLWQRQILIREPALEITNLLRRTFEQGVKNFFLAFEVGIDASLGQARAFRQALHRHCVVCPIREFDQGRVEYFLFPGGRGQVAALVVWRVIFLGWHSKALFKDLRGVPMGLSPALPRIRAFLEPKPAARIDLRQ